MFLPVFQESLVRFSFFFFLFKRYGKLRSNFNNGEGEPPAAILDFNLKCYMQIKIVERCCKVRIVGYALTSIEMNIFIYILNCTYIDIEQY